MRVILATIGRLKAGPDRELFDRYWQRFATAGRALGLAPAVLVELHESRAASATQRKTDEANQLLKAIGTNATRIVLDETGTVEDSPSFARRLRRIADGGCPTLALAIGGPDGHGTTMLDRADCVLSLGRMTLPHGLARIVVAEQLYRATTILSGHPYHRA